VHDNNGGDKADNVGDKSGVKVEGASRLDAVSGGVEKWENEVSGAGKMRDV
jgi:hypothetical protein